MDDILINYETRILVLSISSWNIKKGMNTWPALLEGHAPDCIAHICFRQDIPNNPVCNNYFVISENKVIKSIIKRNLKTGLTLKRCNDNVELAEELIAQKKRYNKMKKHRNVFTLLGRELLWKIGKWKTKELKAFVNDFRPDMILYGMEGYLYFNRICRYVKKISNAKSIGFFYDDNFTYKQRQGLANYFLRFFQRNSLKKLAKHTDNFFSIIPKMKKEADDFFGIDSVLLSKPCYHIPLVDYSELQFPIKILYTGNLGIDRDKSLLKVVEAIKRINLNKNYFELIVYTSTELSESVKNLFSCDFCSISGAISQDEVLKLQKEFDVLLFLEAIAGKNVKTARLSFSTKITDYFSAGKCIFAVGAKDIAPIEYLKENDCAIVATAEEEIYEQLKTIVEDTSVLRKYAINAVECAKQNHIKNKILTIFNETIENTIKK